MLIFVQRSLKIKIMVLILLVTGFITILLISLSAQLSNTYLTDLLNQHGSQTVELYETVISKWLEERETDLEVYSENPLVKELKWEEIDDYLKEEQRKHDQYNLFFIADSEGDFHSTADVKGSIADRPYFGLVMEGNSIISQPVVSKVSGEDIIVVAAPIKKEDQVIGLMGATIKLEILSNFVNNFQLDFRDAISFIVNIKGDIVTHPEKSFIMKENIFKPSSNITENLADKVLLINSKEKSSFFYKKENKNISVYFQRINALPEWYFVAQVSKELVDNYIYGAVRKLIIIGLIGIILSLLLSYLISRSISGPIIGLKEVFVKAANGDLSVRASTKRKDEIGQASKGFNTMMDTLNHVTYYDSRTGLPNRKSLDDFLRVLCFHAETNKERFAVITLNIDQYNRIVDSMGHANGDRLLSLLANELKNISNNVKVYSWLGAQFVILLTEIKQVKDIYHFIRKISLIINKQWEIEEISFYVTSSMGIAVYPENGSDEDTLLKNSSLALHRAIDNSDSDYQFYNPEMNDKLIEDINLDNALRIALEKKQFVLYYQPQYDITGQEIVGLEALIRWIHPVKGIISPGKFIPIAEENGLIKDIGLWVLEEACSQAAYWQEKGLKEVKVAVNIATSQLMQDNFVDIVKEILSNTGLRPGLLELEITERAMVSSVNKTIEILNILKEMGINIAVDDFGTGYSSLQYLKDFALNHLKIDMSFIQQLFDKESNKEIVRAIIAMGHSLNLKVTAEGIEDERQLRFLKENNCDFIQGYYFSKPLPVEEVEKLLI